MTLTRPPMTQAAVLSLFVVSAALALWTLHRALSIEPEPARTAPQSAAAGAVPSPAPGISPATLSAAVRKAPFRAERTPPTRPFRLPGEPLATAAPGDTARSTFQLIGTAVLTGGGGFAMCQFGDAAPKLVRIGERIGELTLTKVAQGRAVFADPGGRRTELRVPKAGT